MSLQFVFGQAGSGKSEYCINKAICAEEKKQRVIMIVPEQYSHQGENAFLKAKGYIHDDFNVTSFGRLARKLISSSGITHSVTDDAGRAMLVLRAINNCKKKLSFYKSAMENQGYISLFMDAISELKKGQVTPEALRVAASETSESLFSARLSDISCIYEEYNKLLSDNVCDANDDLTLAASICFDSEYIKNAEIIIDEFYRFTQNELALIQAFLAVGAHVTISLCMPERVPESSVFQSVKDTKNQLSRIANDVKAEILLPVIINDSPRFLSNELLYLEKATSGKKTIWDNPPEDISLYIAKDKYEEVICTAANIKKFVAKSGAAYHEIAVITGDYNSYSDLVQSIFPMYDIPVFADTRQNFLSHPIVLYLFSIFDLLTGINTKRVITYMKSGFADITQEEAFYLENYALSKAIEYNDWLDDNRFMENAKNIFENKTLSDDSNITPEIKNRVLAPIILLKNKILASKTVSDRVSALISFFEATNLKEKISQYINEFKDKCLLRQADEFAEVYNILMETLATMVQLLGNESIGISGMRAVLEAGFAQKSIGVIPTVFDQVSFGDLNRSVIKNVKALFILGANDGIFPSIPSSETLFSDSERKFLLSHSISVAPDIIKRIADTEFSIYNAINICREKLFVSYPISDNGNGLRPAMFISKLKRVFPRLHAQHELDSDEQSPETTIASRQSAFNYVLTHIGELNKNKTAQCMYDILYKDELYRDRLTRATAFSHYSNKAGTLSQQAVLMLYGKNLYGSVSSFERFSACPFSFFIEYGLKAKDRKVLKVDAPDIGSLLHKIIEQFSVEIKRLGKSFYTITEDEQRTITDSIIDDMFSSMIIKNIYSVGRINALKKRLKSLVSKSVWVICRHIAMGKFEPLAFEVSFDKNGDLPPVTIPLPDGSQITMRGRIDRIDTFSHEGKLYLKIIDYKSGSKGYSLTDIFNGVTLQLAVYTMAATDGISKVNGNNIGFGGMFYFHLDDPISLGTPNTKLDEKNTIKDFKMSGLSSDKPEIICAIDGNTQGWSSVIPVYLKKDGTVSKSQSKTADEEQFENLKKYIKNVLSKIGNEIMSGNVDISPTKDGKFMPCNYCKYIAVCGFDPDIHPCRRLKHFKSDDEIWSLMK